MVGRFLSVLLVVLFFGSVYVLDKLKIGVVGLIYIYVYWIFESEK